VGDELANFSGQQKSSSEATMPKPHNKVGRARTHRSRRVGTVTREVVRITLDQRLLWGMRIPIADNRGSVFSQPHHKAFMDPVLKKSGGTGRKRTKPYITPEQFDELVARIPEPYASMIYVAVYTGLRVSELAGLKWNDVIAIEQVNEKGELEVRYTISIDERFCRGDWGAPKSDASNATIGVNRCVYERIQRLKLLMVEVRAGTAVRRYRVVKSDNPEDLVFQSVQKGAPMRDNNILSRHIKPAARAGISNLRPGRSD